MLTANWICNIGSVTILSSIISAYRALLFKGKRINPLDIISTKRSFAMIASEIFIGHVLMQHIQDNFQELPAKKTQRGRAFLLALIALVTGIMLFAGLQPYANYKDNWVSFTDLTSETEFGKYGLAIGTTPEFVEIAAKNNQLQLTITPIITEPRDTNFHVLAQFYSPGFDTALMIGQWKTSIIAINGSDRTGSRGFARISANLSRHIGIPTEVRFTFSEDKSLAELDNRFEAESNAFNFSNPITHLTVGNSPDGKFGWYGGLANIKIIDTANPSNAISYRFDKNTLPKIHADTSELALSSEDDFSLTIPAVGGFPNKEWIGKLELNQLLDNNLRDIVINLFGFAPFGFLLAAFLGTGTKQVHWVIAVTLITVVGFLFSAGIESTQTIIPGRNSHMHDLLLNTLGALAGAIGFFIFAAFWTFIKRPKTPTERNASDPLEVSQPGNIEL